VTQLVDNVNTTRSVFQQAALVISTQIFKDKIYIYLCIIIIIIAPLSILNEDEWGDLDLSVVNLSNSNCCRYQCRVNVAVKRFQRCSVDVMLILFQSCCMCLYDAAPWSKFNVGTMEN